MSMNSTEIDLFIHKWHEVLYYADIQRQNMADGMIEQLHQPMFSYLKDLIKTPLHLANIILIAKEFGRIPNDKIQLYDDYLRITLHWNANDIIDDKGNNPSRINNGFENRIVIHCISYDESRKNPIYAYRIKRTIAELFPRLGLRIKISYFRR